MLMALALLMPETVGVLEVATELNATPVWALKLKGVGDGIILRIKRIRQVVRHEPSARSDYSFYRGL